MVSLFLLLGCNLSYIVDLFAALHELASASSRTLLKLASSVRALLKPYGDTLKTLRLKLFTSLGSLIVWLRELKSETAWYCVLCIPQFLLTRGNLKLLLLRVLCLWRTSCLIKSTSWLIRPLMHLYTCTHLLWNCLFSRGSHLRAANASVEDEYNGLFKITLAALFCKTCKLDISPNIMFIAPDWISIFKKRHNKTFIEK